MQMALTVRVTFSTLPWFKIGLKFRSVFSETFADSESADAVGRDGEREKGGLYKYEEPCAHL